MQIIQETRTIIKAEDGKVLRKKNTGRVVGDTVHLGYNYYEAGVPLAEPRLAVPDDYEEIDTPEDYKEVEIINQAKRLAVMQRLFEEEKKEISKRKLTATEMLAVKNLYPRWGEDIKEGDTVTKGMKFLYTDGKLYVVRQDHTILTHYYPSVNTAALYEEITPEYNENGELGTLDNPIAYEGNMALEEGKYYSQDNIVYLCNRDTGNPVYHNLSELVGLYVEVV